MKLKSAALALVVTLAGSTAALAGGVNVGTLTCDVEGGVGFVFGSSKDMSCVFTRPDGTAERYHGEVNKFGVDIGYTNEAHMVWGVFSAGEVGQGALAGSYAGATASATAGLGVGANALVGGSNDQIGLQPVSIEGNEGLNVAAGIGEITLRPGR
jgi:hypothetical protein